MVIVGMWGGLSSAKAQTELTLSIDVGDTVVTFSGWTAPNSLVTIKENGVAVGTALSDEQGFFTKTLTAQTPENKVFQLSSTHLPSGSMTDTVEYSVYLTPTVETTLSNIVFPPTAELSATQVLPDEQLLISGWAPPGSVVELMVGADYFLSFTAGEQGYWSGSISAVNLQPGVTFPVVATVIYHGFASQEINVGSFSVLFFQVPSPTPTPLPTPTPTQSPGAGDDSDDEGEGTTDSVMTPAPTVISDGKLDFGQPNVVVAPTVESLPEILRQYDFNQSGRLDPFMLDRISEHWWNAYYPVKQNLATCDLNADQRCDIIDFSILMYWVEKE